MAQRFAIFTAAKVVMKLPMLQTLTPVEKTLLQQVGDAIKAKDTEKFMQTEDRTTLPRPEPGVDTQGVGDAQAGAVGNFDITIDAIETKGVADFAGGKGCSIEQRPIVCSFAVAGSSFSGPPACKARRWGCAKGASLRNGWTVAEKYRYQCGSDYEDIFAIEGHSHISNLRFLGKRIVAMNLCRSPEAWTTAVSCREPLI